MPTTAPTKAQITAASSTLDEVAQSLWVSYIRQSECYRARPLGYPNLAETIAAAAAEAGLKAQQLNAALTLIDEKGPGEIEIKEDGATISKTKDRSALVDYGISVLYDEPIGSEAQLSGRRSGTSVVQSPAGW